MNGYKECPYCAGQILAGAIKCKHCKSMLGEIPASPPPPPPADDPTPGGQPSPPSVYTHGHSPEKGQPAGPGARTGKTGLLIASLAAAFVLGLAVLAVVIFLNIDTHFPGEKPSQGDPSPAPGPNREIPTSKDKPDFTVLESVILLWLQENLQDSFYLFHEDYIPDLDRYFLTYGQVDLVVVYKIESVVDNQAAVLLGLPFSEAFCRLTFQWRQGKWIILSREDLW